MRSEILQSALFKDTLRSPICLLIFPLRAKSKWEREREGGRDTVGHQGNRPVRPISECEQTERARVCQRVAYLEGDLEVLRVEDRETLRELQQLPWRCEPLLGVSPEDLMDDSRWTNTPHTHSHATEHVCMHTSWRHTQQRTLSRQTRSFWNASHRAKHVQSCFTQMKRYKCALYIWVWVFNYE